MAAVAAPTGAAKIQKYEPNGTAASYNAASVHPKPRVSLAACQACQSLCCVRGFHHRLIDVVTKEWGLALICGSVCAGFHNR